MEYSAKTDVGKKRIQNEDSYLVNGEIDGGIFIVADGMGGHNAGEVASLDACRITESFILESENKDENAIVAAIKKANRDIFQRASENNAMRGMGTTIDVCYITKNLLTIGHVGDSRVYVINQSGIKQITHDHSVVGMMLEEGTISEEEARLHPQRNIITRAVGTSVNVEVDVEKYSLDENDTILMCTDGLTGMVTPSEICSIVLNAQSLIDACNALVSKANENGGKDNITVILIKPFGQKVEDK